MALGPVMLDLEGPEMSAEERELLLEPAVGGVVLFAHNYQEPAQMRALTDAVHALREPRLLVAVDHEGGPVQRFRRGLTRIPAAACFGRHYDRDARHARQLTRASGWLVATELGALGVDFCFGPVLDLARERGAIGERAYHRDPHAVSSLANALVQGLREAGMSAVGKHFPGHGSVSGDSHVMRPEDPRDLETLRLADLVPFQRLIERGVPGIMPAHIAYRAVDSRPAGYSEIWLRRILRGQLGFQGAVFSDDLAMAGAGEPGGFSARARLALQAGCDIVLICQQREAAASVVIGLDVAADPRRAARLMRMHGRAATADWEAMLADSRHREAAAAIEALDPEPELDLGDE